MKEKKLLLEEEEGPLTKKTAETADTDIVSKYFGNVLRCSRKELDSIAVCLSAEFVSGSHEEIVSMEKQRVELLLCPILKQITAGEEIEKWRQEWIIEAVREEAETCVLPETLDKLLDAMTPEKVSDDDPDEPMRSYRFGWLIIPCLAFEYSSKRWKYQWALTATFQEIHKFLVWYLKTRFNVIKNSPRFDDLFSTAKSVALETVKKYDVTKSTFSTFITLHLKGALIKELNSQNGKMSAYYADKLSKVEKAKAELAQKGLRNPSDAEVAKVTGFSMSEIRTLNDIRTKADHVYIDAEDPETGVTMQIPTETTAPETLAIENENTAELVEAIMRIPNKDCRRVFLAIALPYECLYDQSDLNAYIELHDYDDDRSSDSSYTGRKSHAPIDYDRLSRNLHMTKKELKKLVSMGKKFLKKDPAIESLRKSKGYVDKDAAMKHTAFDIPENRTVMDLCTYQSTLTSEPEEFSVDDLVSVDDLL